MTDISNYCNITRNLYIPCKSKCKYGMLCDLAVKNYYTILGNLDFREIEKLKEVINNV